MLIDIIAGARPNFIKIAPIIKAIEFKQQQGFPVHYRLIHTGQHYDRNMSGDFFEQLDIPVPYINLEAGAGTQAEQTSKIMLGYEQVLKNRPCDLCIVVGDVTSTMACAIVAKKANNIKVAHVEAGIRSGDWTMPEEINRIVTDAVTDYFFTTTVTAGKNLEKQGVLPEHIFFVGNTMIDTLHQQAPYLAKPAIWDRFSLQSGKYIVITLHRPNNVDNKEKLKQIIDCIVDASKGCPLVFPVHPHTSNVLKDIKFGADNLHTVTPLGYREFNFIVKNAMAVVTDSGGVTEETTVMGIPCMTLRDSTERPETCITGTNELLGTNPVNLSPAFEKLFSGRWKKGAIPELWDGHAAERIVEHICTLFQLRGSVA